MMESGSRRYVRYYKLYFKYFLRFFSLSLPSIFLPILYTYNDSDTIFIAGSGTAVQGSILGVLDHNVVLNDLDMAVMTQIPM